MSTPAEARTDLSRRLVARALEMDLDAAGVALAVAPPGYPHFLDWLDRGDAGPLAYMHAHAEARGDPAHVLPGVRGVLVVAMTYGERRPASPEPRRGRVACYAQGRDYHEVLWRKLDALLDWIRGERPDVRGRAVADTAPLLERDFARLAGLGWIGRNTMLIHPRLGSFTVLGALLLDLDLEPSLPFTADHCGTCTRCLDACPTGALVAPGRLDARRCISTWTIEHRGPLPDSMADQLHGWAFGCDICQEVCPWNRKAPAGRVPELLPRDDEAHAPDLIAWLERSPEEMAAQLAGTPLTRPKRDGLVRNAAHVLGARSVIEAVPALVRRLDDPSAVVRGAAAWALGALGTGPARQALEAHRDDPDEATRAAVARALRRIDGDQVVDVPVPEFVPSDGL